MTRTVITYGTYDLFHSGHLNLLLRARGLGDRLVVGVSTDEFNAKKQKSSIFSYKERALIISSLKPVDLVFPEDNWDQKYDDIKKYDCDLLVMGSDWVGRFDHFRSICDVQYLPRTEGISTSDLRLGISSLAADRIAEVARALGVAKSLLEQL